MPKVVMRIKKVPTLQKTKKTTGKFHLKQVFATFAVFALAFSVIGNTPVNADSPHIATISVTSITDESGTHNAPFNFSCQSDPLFNPVNIVGSGTVTNPAGHISDYHYSVDWGDGSTSSVGQTFSGTDPYSFSFDFGPHNFPYSTTSTFTITVIVYHAQSAGKDTTDDQVVTIPVCVHVPPSTNASVTVNKTVINDNSGTKQAGDFTLKVNGTTVTNGVVADFAASAAPYTITETPTAGYTASFSGDCDSNGVITTVVAGQHYVCDMVNNDNPVIIQNPGTLTVIKNVVNDNGGTAHASDFTLHVSGGNADPPSFSGSDAGTPVTIDAGAVYSVSEDSAANYSSDVTGTGCSGTMPADGQITCTVTNTYVPPLPDKGTISVTKVVVNDNSGTLTPADFTLNVNSTSVVSGAVNNFDPGDYTISEAATDGYTQTGLTCTDGSNSLGSSFTLVAGENVSCTITNDDIAPVANTGSITVCKIITDGNGNIVDGSDFPATGAFTISWSLNPPAELAANHGQAAGIVPTSIFDSPLQLNTKVLTASQGNDSECRTYTGLAYGSYYYLPESISAQGWGTPLYNDQFNSAATDLSTFYAYGDQNFNNSDADGHIVIDVSPYVPDRTLLVLNTEPAEVNNGNGNSTSTDFTLTLTKTGDGNGSVDGSVDGATSTTFCALTECGPNDEKQSFTATYASGTVVTLTPNPDGQSNFNGTWSGACSGTAPCTLVMTGNMSANAHFGLNTITTSTSGGTTGGGGGGTVVGGGTTSGGGCQGGTCGSNLPIVGTPQVLGASTGLQMPAAQPEVLGAATTLPRTGMPAGMLLLLALIPAAVLNKKLKLV